MKYLDKSLNRTVELVESRRNFLVIAEPEEAETAAVPLLSQKVFTVTPSTNRDGVYVLEIKAENESPVEIDKTIKELASNSRIRSVAPALVDRQGNVRYALPGQVVVQFRNMSEKSAQSYLARLGSSIVKKYRSPGLYEVSAPGGAELGDFINTLNSNPKVQFAEPSFYGINDSEVRVVVLDPTSETTSGSDGQSPDSTGHVLPWNLEKLSLREAWQQTQGRAEIVVGVIDEMPDTGHEAIDDKFISPVVDSLVFTDNRQLSSHATNICSIVAGESESLQGVAPGVRLLPLVVNLHSQAYAERADAIRQAASLARAGQLDGTPFSRLVLSCSWKTSGDIAVIRTALEEAVTSGILCIFSAGNDSNDLPHYPSDYSAWPGVLGEGVIAVAATDQGDRKAGYSNYSRNVNVCAPGGDGLPFDERDVFCADQGGTYVFSAGTSIAAPHVAATAALLLSLNPNLSPKELKRLIMDNADDIRALNLNFADVIGSGRVNARRALAAVATYVPVETPGSGVRDQLRQCADALLAATGWSLTLAEVVKGGVRATIELD